MARLAGQPLFGHGRAGVVLGGAGRGRGRRRAVVGRGVRLELHQVPGQVGLGLVQIGVLFVAGRVELGGRLVGFNCGRVQMSLIALDSDAVQFVHVLVVVQVIVRAALQKRRKLVFERSQVHTISFKARNEFKFGKNVFNLSTTKMWVKNDHKTSTTKMWVFFDPM